MNEDTAQRISALLDGEVDRREADEVSALLVSDREARDTFLAYQRVRETMRGERDPRFYRASIADQVRAALEAPVPAEDDAPLALGDAEPAVNHLGGSDTVVPFTAPDVAPDVPAALPATRRDWRPMALAASLFLAAALGFGLARHLPGESDSAPLAALDSSGLPSTEVGTASSNLGSAPVSAVRRVGWDTDDPAIQRRLQGYLVSHSEYLGRGMRGMHPYARVVAHAGAQQ